MMTLSRAAAGTLSIALGAHAGAQPGTPDPTFNAGQPVLIGPWGSGGGFGVLNGAVVQSDGRVVAIGKPAQTGFGAIRFNLDGSVDPTFGRGGGFMLAYAAAGGSLCAGLGAIQGARGAEDRLILLDDRFQAVCLTADGMPDLAFGAGGVVSMCGFDRRNWISGSVAVQGDGKIVLAGASVPNSGNNPTYDLTLVRLNVDGRLDLTFGSFGRKSTPGYVVDAQPGHQQVPRGGLAIRSDGRIVVAVGFGDAQGQPYVAQYLANGALDTAFGVGGRVAISLSGGRDAPRGLVLTDQGGFILEAVQGQTLSLARYTAAGALDPSYGVAGSGRVSVTLPGGATAYYGIARQQDGSILVPMLWPDGGSSGGEATGDQAALRFTPSGLLDSGFGPSGSGLSQLMGWVGQHEHARAVVVDPLGRIVLVGLHSTPENAGSMNGPMVSVISSH